MKLIEYIRILDNDKKNNKYKLIIYKLYDIKKQTELLKKKIIFKEICEDLNIPFIKWYYILNSIDLFKNIELDNLQCILKSDNSTCCNNIYYRIPKDGYFKLKDGVKIKKNSMINSIKLNKTKIIIEELLEDKYYRLLNGVTKIKRLTDYKLYFYYGKFYYFKVYNENVVYKYKKGATYYSYKFDKILVDDKNYTNPNMQFCYEFNQTEINKMKEYSEKIYNKYMKNIPYVRFDYYITTKGIKLGEITYTNDNGNYSFLLDKYLGNIFDKQTVLKKMDNFILYNKLIYKVYKKKYNIFNKLKYIDCDYNIFHLLLETEPKTEKEDYEAKHNEWIKILKILKIYKYHDKFYSEEIKSKDDLLQLTENDLITLNIKLGDRNRIKKYIEQNI